MAYAAEIFKIAENVGHPSEIASQGSAHSSTPGPLDRAICRDTDALLVTKNFVGAAFRRAQAQAANTFARLAAKSGDFGRRARDRADQIRKEHPVELLAVIGGAGIALGIIARVVRRSRHAD